jgi:hypothetical protein
MFFLVFFYRSCIGVKTTGTNDMGLNKLCGLGSSVGIATELQAGRSGDRIPVGARFSSPVQTGPGTHPASCTMCTGSFPGGKERPGRDADSSLPSSAVGLERVELYLYSHYGPYGLYRASVPVQGCTLPLPYSTAIPLLPLWTVRPVQSLSACARVHFTFTLQ